jgi:riboflavin synthase
MFTGLVQSLAEVVDVVPEPPGVRFIIGDSSIAAAAKIGDSIAINGCCLTVVEIRGDQLAFLAGEETLSRTNLGELLPKAVVNLEQ